MDPKTWATHASKVTPGQAVASAGDYKFITENLTPQTIQRLAADNADTIRAGLPQKRANLVCFHSFARLRAYIEGSPNKKEYNLDQLSLEECEQSTKQTGSWKQAVADPGTVLIILGTLMPLPDKFVVFTFTHTTLKLA